VKSVRLVSDPGELVDVSVKPNYRKLGPRFGKRMPEVAEAVAALDSAAAARALDAGERVEITVGGAPELLDAEELLREARPTEGYAVGQSGGVAVGLATELTPDLRREGLAREITHAVQNARKAAGLKVEERIALHLDGSGLAREAIDAHREQIAADTLAVRLTVGHGAPFAGIRHEEHVLEGEPVALRLERAQG
jgi:isoleucyl-tRNA synthetase